jgi:hypothetical protein
MLPKSKQHCYISFDDGARAIKFYNTEMRKILTSWNFRHLTPVDFKPPELVEIIPKVSHKGELDGNTSIPKDVAGEENIAHLDKTTKQRRLEVEEVNLEEPCKMHGKCINYHYLNDPYPDEEDDKESYLFEVLSEEEVYAIIAGDELTSLNDAQNSPEWPEWQHAIKEKLKLLESMGIWELEEKPPDAIPIGNKWVFIRKCNKQGEIIYYHARLVAKGCAQRPSHNYMETFSLVVQMDTLRATLALVLLLDLRIQQMDVKGAYLNSILQETIFMGQPEGCKDGIR